MIFAKIDSWFTVLIFVIWGVSALLEFMRKKKLKEKRREALKREREASPQDEVASQHEAWAWREEAKQEAVQKRNQALEEAEEQVKYQAYQPTPVGRDLEVNLEDLFEAAASPHAFEIIETAKKLPPPKVESLAEIEEPIEEIIASEGETKEETSAPGSSQIFPSGIRSAIIASEVLGPARSRQLWRRAG